MSGLLCLLQSFGVITSVGTLSALLTRASHNSSFKTVFVAGGLQPTCRGREYFCARAESLNGIELST